MRTRIAVGLVAALVMGAGSAVPARAGSDERVRFVNEGSGCDSTKTLFLDNDTGRELFCEGNDYDGPLSDEQKDAVVALAVQLAKKGGLSDAEKAKVDRYARHPRTAPVAGRTVGPIDVGDDAVWVAGLVTVPGGANAAEVAVRVPTPSGNQRALRLGNRDSIRDLQAAAGRLWVLGGGSGGLIEIDSATLRRAHADRSLNDIDHVTIEAAEDGTLWILYARPSNSGSEDATVTRLERIDASGEISEVWRPTGTIGLYGPVVGEGAVWFTDGLPFDFETGHLFRVDPASGRLTASSALPFVIANPFDRGSWDAGEGALWFVAWTKDDLSQDRYHVTRVDPATSSPVATVELCDQPRQPCLQPIGLSAGAGAVWVLLPKRLASNDMVVVRIDPATNTVVDTIDVPPVHDPELESQGSGDNPGIVAANDTVWVVDQFGQLFRIDPGTNKIKRVKLRFEFGLRT